MKRLIPVICATCTFLSVPLLSSKDEEGKWELFSKIEQISPFRQISPFSVAYSTEQSSWPFTIQGQNGSDLTQSSAVGQSDYYVSQDTNSFYSLDISTTKPVTIGTNHTGTSVECYVTGTNSESDTWDVSFDGVRFESSTANSVVNIGGYYSTVYLRGTLTALTTSSNTDGLYFKGNAIVTGKNTVFALTSEAIPLFVNEILTIQDGATVIATTMGTQSNAIVGNKDILVDGANLLTFAPNSTKHQKQSVDRSITVTGDSFVCVQGSETTLGSLLTTDGSGTIYSSPNLSYVNGQVVVTGDVLTKHEVNSADNTSITVNSGSLVVTKTGIVAGSSGANVTVTEDGEKVDKTLAPNELLSGGSGGSEGGQEDSKTSLTGAVISGYSGLTYTGEVQQPILDVKLNNVTLEKDKDYTLAFTGECIHAGTYSFTVAGMGDYTDSVTQSYTIAKAPLVVKPRTGQSHYLGDSMGQINYDAVGIIYGEPVDFTGALTLDSPATSVGVYTILKGDLDFDTSIEGYLSTDYDLQVDETILYQVRDPDIVPVDLSGAELSKISPVTYSGEEQCPSLTVTHEGTTLVENVDYILSYKDNKNHGLGLVTITGCGAYEGEESATFLITRKTLILTPSAGLQHDYGESDVAITYTVTGQVEGETPEFTGSLGRSTGSAVGTYVIAQGSVTQINTATCLAQNYNISLQSAEYEIVPKDLASLHVSDISSLVYNGTTQIPSFTIKNQGIPLVEGTDYTLSVENHQNVGLGNLSLTGLGNYTGTQTALFQIMPKEILVTPTSGQYHVFGGTESSLSYTYTGQVTGETPLFTGSLSRASGNSVGTYAISSGSLAFRDNGTFSKENYVLSVASGVSYEIKAVTITPDTSTPDTSTPDTSTPDTSTPDTSTPDTSTPDTSTPDTSTPDTGTPDTSTPDTSTPDTSTPDTSTPDTSTPDTSTPDTSTPDTSTPDTSTPDTSTPDTSTPDTSTPDTSTPDTSTPDTSTPDTSTPDTSTPDTSTPDTSTPDTSTPDTSTPDTSTPDTSTPDVGTDSNQNNDSTGGSDSNHDSNAGTDSNGNTESGLGSDSSTGNSSGDSSTGNSSGDSSTGNSSGDSSTGNSSGDSSTGNSSGDSSTGNSSGDSSTGNSSGDSSTGNSSGDSSTGNSSGDSSTGNSSGDSSTGNGSSGSSTGNSSSGSSTGNSSSGSNSATGNANSNADSTAPSISTNTSGASGNGTTSGSGTSGSTGGATESTGSEELVDGIYPAGTTFHPETGEPIYPTSSEGAGSEGQDSSSPQADNLGVATDLSQETFLQEEEGSGLTIGKVIAGAAVATVGMIGVGVAVTAGNVGMATAVAGSSNVVGTSMLDKAYDLFRRVRSILSGESEESTLRRFKLKRKKPFSEQLLLKNAKRRHYALPQVEVSSYDMVDEILDSVKEEKSPIVFDVSYLMEEHEEDEDYHDVMDRIHAVVKQHKVRVPLGYHLQVDSYESCLESFDLGLSSIMYEISDIDDEEEIENLTKLCKMAKKKQITMEVCWNLVDEEGEHCPISEEDCETLERCGVSAVMLDMFTSEDGYPANWEELLTEAVEEVQDAGKKLHIILQNEEEISSDSLEDLVHGSVNKIRIFEDDLDLEDMSIFSEKLESIHATGKGSPMLKTINTCFRFCTRFMNYF